MKFESYNTSPTFSLHSVADKGKYPPVIAFALQLISQSISVHLNPKYEPSLPPPVAMSSSINSISFLSHKARNFLKYSLLGG